MGLIFLSHAAADADLAGFIEDQIRRLVPGSDVFRTSRTGQIMPGDEWFRVITDNLKAAERYVVLLTPNSIARPWMWFEAGAGWMSGRQVLPITAAMSPSAVPEPLKFFQIYSIEQPAEATKVFEALGGELTDPSMFADAVRTLAEQVRAAHDAAEGWEGFEFGKYFMAWDGPLDSLVESFPIPTPDGLVNRLRDMGVVAQYGIKRDLSAEHAAGLREFWAVDRALRRRHNMLMTGGQVLLVRPPSPPRVA